MRSRFAPRSNLVAQLVGTGVVRNGHLESTPFVKGTIPKAERKTIHLIEADEFERLQLACRTGGDTDSSIVRAAADNRAILWVFLDTGMRVSQLYKMRLNSNEEIFTVVYGRKKRIGWDMQRADWDREQTDYWRHHLEC